MHRSKEHWLVGVSCTTSVQPSELAQFKHYEESQNLFSPHLDWSVEVVFSIVKPYIYSPKLFKLLVSPLSPIIMIVAV